MLLVMLFSRGFRMKSGASGVLDECCTFTITKILLSEMLTARPHSSWHWGYDGPRTEDCASLLSMLTSTSRQNATVFSLPKLYKESRRHQWYIYRNRGRTQYSGLLTRPLGSALLQRDDRRKIPGSFPLSHSHSS